MAMITWTADKTYGGSKPYIAVITGTDARYGFARTFLSGTCVHVARSGRTEQWDYVIDAPGIYERRDGKTGLEWRVVWPTRDGGLKWRTITENRCQEIAQAMNTGLDAEAARKATAPVTT